MNLLITGGSGFIGTRLVRELLESGRDVLPERPPLSPPSGHVGNVSLPVGTSCQDVRSANPVGTFCQNVRPAAHGPPGKRSLPNLVSIYDLVPSPEFPHLCIRGDVRDLKALSAAAAKRDAIIHLAAEHRDDPQSAALADEVNVGGARNVIAAARQAGCRRIVFTSSVAVYPLNAPELTEDSPPLPYNRYGESKLTAERLFAEWAQNTPGASLAIVRACVVFGEGNRGNVYNLLRQIQRGRFVMVGNGRNRKSMAYVGNVARFLATCLDLPSGFHLFNYADKPDLSVGELVALTRRELEVLSPRRKGQGRLRRFQPSAFSLQHFSSAPSLRLPYCLGLLAGHGADAFAFLTGRQFPITASRICKFCAVTTVSTRRLERTGFVRPFGLEEALVRTIQYEFGRNAGGEAET